MSNKSATKASETSLIDQMALLFEARYRMSPTEAQHQAQYYMRVGGPMAESFMIEAKNFDTGRMSVDDGSHGTPVSVAKAAQAPQGPDAQISQPVPVTAPYMPSPMYRPPAGQDLTLLNNKASYQAAKGAATGAQDLRPLKLLANREAYQAASGATAGLPPLSPVSQRVPPAPLTPQTIALPAAQTPAHDEDADLSTWQRFHDLIYSKPTTKAK